MICRTRIQVSKLDHIVTLMSIVKLCRGYFYKKEHFAKKKTQGHEHFASVFYFPSY